MVELLSRDNVALREKLENVYSKMNSMQTVNKEKFEIGFYGTFVITWISFPILTWTQGLRSRQRLEANGSEGSKNGTFNLLAKTRILRIFLTIGIKLVVHSLARGVCITNIKNVFLNYNIHQVDAVARVTVKKITSLLRVVDKLHLSGSSLRSEFNCLVWKT